MGRAETLRVSRHVERIGREEENFHVREKNTTAAGCEIYAGPPGDSALYLEGEKPELHERQRGRKIHQNELQGRWVSRNALSKSRSIAQ